MQPTTLNKIVALFLVGSLSLLFCFLINWDILCPVLYQEDSSSDPPLSPAIAVLAAFFLLPASALLGATVDGLAALTIRRLIRLSRKKRGVAFLFGKSGDYDLLIAWHDKYKEALEASRAYSTFLEQDPDLVYSVGPGQLFRTAKADHLEWVTRHYATFLLSYNFAFVVGLATIIAPFKLLDNPFTLNQLVVLILFGVVMFYGLCSLAVDRYLYAFHASFRNGWMAIHAPELECEQDRLSEEPQNTSVQTDPHSRRDEAEP